MPWEVEESPTNSQNQEKEFCVFFLKQIFLYFVFCVFFSMIDKQNTWFQMFSSGLEFLAAQ